MQPQHTVQCRGRTNTAEALRSPADARVLQSTLTRSSLLSSSTYDHAVFTSHNTAWQSLRLRQAERPTFKTGFSKAAASRPKAGPCIIHVHLHNLLSLYRELASQLRNRSPYEEGTAAALY